MILAYADRLAKKGHQVHIYSNIIETVFEIPNDVIIQRITWPGKLGTILSSLITRFDTDFVICDIVAMAFLLSLRNKGKVVHFAQDYNENVYNNFVQKMLIRFLYEVTLSLFKVPTIAVSVQLADELNRKFDAEAKVIKNGIDLRVFYPEPCNLLKERKKGRKAILFFSRRDHRKGFDIALRAIDKISLCTEIPLEVWTVGEPLKDGEAHCLQHNFGYVREPELRRILSSADLFLYPSRCEGFPIMVMEAFACHCPVVTTKAVPYAVDYGNALVAQIEDVDGLVTNMKRILMDEKLAVKLADTAGEFVLQYSLDFSADEFSNTLEVIMEKRCSKINQYW